MVAISDEFLQLRDKDKMWHFNRSRHNPRVCVPVCVPVCVCVCVCVDLKTKILLEKEG